MLGIHQDDAKDVIPKLVSKIIQLRLFPSEQKPIDVDIKSIDGDILVVSQFTLYADCKKWNRPSFSKSAWAEVAGKLYKAFVKEMETQSGKKVATWVFWEHMDVSLVNDGPVTIMLDTDEL